MKNTKLAVLMLTAINLECSIYNKNIKGRGSNIFCIKIKIKFEASFLYFITKI